MMERVGPHSNICYNVLEHETRTPAAEETGMFLSAPSEADTGTTTPVPTENESSSIAPATTKIEAGSTPPPSTGKQAGTTTVKPRHAKYMGTTKPEQPATPISESTSS